jgi:hypothetical protein
MVSVGIEIHQPNTPCITVLCGLLFEINQNSFLDCIHPFVHQSF